MLIHVDIRNLAVVEALSLELQPGLTVLTGETGAGKSILLGALGLALGDRADSGLIRHGAERAEVSATFDLADAPAARHWLAGRDLEGDEGLCIIRRLLSRGSASRAFINGRPATLQDLRELGGLLVDLHGQHEHQSLLGRPFQRALLDDYAGNGPRLAELGGAWRRWQEAARRLEALRGAGAERARRLEFLRFQIEELERLAPEPGEAAALEQEHRRLAHGRRLLEGCQRLAQILEGEDETSADALLRRAAVELDDMVQADPALEEPAALLEQATIAVDEAAGAIRRYAERLDLDPARLAEVERRLDALLTLARKHQVDPDELPALLERLQAEAAELDGGEDRLRHLEREAAEARAAYEEAARTLRRRRRQAGARLARAVTAAMQEMGMEGGVFEVAVEPAEPAAHGTERVEFRVAANPGQPPGPLNRVASGGELSRISLAVQVIAAGDQAVPTLVFDEVDVGIGGRVAEIVGQRLRELGAARQVLCVTHLPQVAALGHHHLQVEKRTAEGATRTRIRALDRAERVEEIARMLGGVEITERTRSHAREMMERAGTASGERPVASGEETPADA